ncbi:MAG: hypothetical protein AAFY46_06855 [Planctomycetota bacterium]
MESHRRLTRTDAETLQFWGPIAGGLSVLALAVMFFASPVDDDGLGLYIALGVIHALALLPIGALVEEHRARVLLLFFGALSVGFWVLPLFFVAGYFAILAAGIAWAVFAGIATRRGVLAEALFAVIAVSAFVAVLTSGAIADLPVSAATQGVLAMLLPCGVWHFGATWFTYWALSIPDPRTPGVCGTCAYALEGLTTNTCPECGEPSTLNTPTSADA